MTPSHHGEAVATWRTDVRMKLRSLMDQFILTSRSHRIRVELSDLIVACYVAGHLTRPEYQMAMEDIR